MSTTKKKLIAGTIITASLLVTACSGSGSGGAASQGGGESAAQGQQPVTLTVWDYKVGTDADSLVSQIAEFQQLHPNVKIERTFMPYADINNKILLGNAGNDLPDIVLINNPDHQSFAAAGILADLTEEIKAWGQAGQYYDGSWSSTVYNGKNYGIPDNSSTLALFYNEDMLNAAGVKPPQTWAELREAAVKLSKAPDVYGLGISLINQEQGAYQFLPFLWQSGSDLTNFNSDGTVRAISFLKELIDQGAVSKSALTQTQTDTANLFVTGKLAMVVNGPWQLPLFKKEAKFKWGVVPMPADQTKASALGGENWAITAASENKAAAWQYIQYTQQKEVMIKTMQASGKFPPRRDYMQDPFWQDDPIFKVFTTSLEFTKARAYGPNYPKMSLAVQEMMQKVLTGNTDAPSAVKEAADKINPLLP